MAGAMYLLVYLREHHPPRHEFCVSPEALSPILGSSHVTIRKARNTLLNVGLLIQVYKGTKRGDPYRYRLGQSLQAIERIFRQ